MNILDMEVVIDNTVDMPNNVFFKGSNQNIEIMKRMKDNKVPRKTPSMECHFTMQLHGDNRSSCGGSYNKTKMTEDRKMIKNISLLFDEQYRNHDNNGIQIIRKFSSPSPISLPKKPCRATSITATTKEKDNDSSLSPYSSPYSLPKKPCRATSVTATTGENDIDNGENQTEQQQLQQQGTAGNNDDGSSHPLKKECIRDGVEIEKRIKKYKVMPKMTMSLPPLAGGQGGISTKVAAGVGFQALLPPLPTMFRDDKLPSKPCRMTSRGANTGNRGGNGATESIPKGFSTIRNSSSSSSSSSNLPTGGCFTRAQREPAIRSFSTDSSSNLPIGGCFTRAQRKPAMRSFSTNSTSNLPTGGCFTRAQRKPAMRSFSTDSSTMKFVLPDCVPHKPSRMVSKGRCDTGAGSSNDDDKSNTSKNALDSYYEMTTNERSVLEGNVLRNTLSGNRNSAEDSAGIAEDSNCIRNMNLGGSFTKGAQPGGYFTEAKQTELVVRSFSTGSSNTMQFVLPDFVPLKPYRMVSKEQCDTGAGSSNDDYCNRNKKSLGSLEMANNERGVSECTVLRGTLSGSSNCIENSDGTRLDDDIMRQKIISLCRPDRLPARPSRVVSNATTQEYIK